MAGEKLYYLAKVTDREWAQSLLSGEIFLRAIECFSNLSSRAEDANNSFRGDTLEGVCYSFGNPQNTVLSAEDTSGGGLIDALTLRKKIFCMYSFEYDMDEQQFVIPDKRLLAFGDTVVLILNTKEFLQRICNAVLNRFKDNFWLGFSRVDYSVDLDVRAVYNEFKKNARYGWQNEFRIVLDLALGQFSERTLSGVSDYAKLCFPGRLRIDTVPDSVADTLIINIGNISDICLVLSTEDFINLKRSDDIKASAFFPPPSIRSFEMPRIDYPTFFKIVAKLP